MAELLDDIRPEDLNKDVVRTLTDVSSADSFVPSEQWFEFELTLYHNDSEGCAGDIDYVIGAFRGVTSHIVLRSSDTYGDTYLTRMNMKYTVLYDLIKFLSSLMTAIRTYVYTESNLTLRTYVPNTENNNEDNTAFIETFDSDQIRKMCDMAEILKAPIIGRITTLFAPLMNFTYMDVNQARMKSKNIDTFRRIRMTPGRYSYLFYVEAIKDRITDAPEETLSVTGSSYMEMLVKSLFAEKCIETTESSEKRFADGIKLHRSFVWRPAFPFKVGGPGRFFYSCVSYFKPDSELDFDSVNMSVDKIVSSTYLAKCYEAAESSGDKYAVENVPFNVDSQTALGFMQDVLSEFPTDEVIRDAKRIKKALDKDMVKFSKE